MSTAAPIYSKYPPNASQSVPTVPNAASLPAAGLYDGQLYLTLDTDSLYAWNLATVSWVLLNSSSTVTGSGANGKMAVWNGTSSLGVSSSSGLQYLTSGVVSTVADGTANKVFGMNAAADGYEYKSILGTSNQVTVTHGVGSITLALPQNINVGASPTFAGLTLSGLNSAGVVHTDSGGVFSTSLIVNADVSASAAIAYSKLTLTGSIVNNDVSNTAAIAYSKLNLGGSIVNADIASAAAIAVSKLAALTASRAVVTDGSGFISAATTTAVEIGYVNGVTSAIQTQLNTKSPTASPTFTGTVNITGNLIATSTLAGSNLSGTNTGDVTLTAVGASPNANGASLSGQALTLQAADGSNPGLLTATTQNVGGDKSFSGRIGVFGGARSDSAITVSASANPLASADQYGVIVQMTGTSSATSSVVGFYSEPRTTAVSYTVLDRVGYWYSCVTKGAGSTVTRDVGIYAATPSEGSTGNATICDNLSFSGNYFINSTSAHSSLISGDLTLANVLGVLGSSATNVGIIIRSGTTLPSSSTSQFGILNQATSSASATVATYGVYSAPNTLAAAYTTGFRAAFYADNTAKGSGSTITRDVGMYIETPTQGGTGSASITDSFGFSGSWFIYESGSNPSNFAGPILIADGAAGTPAVRFGSSTGTGIFRPSSNALSFSSNATEVGGYVSTGLWTFGASGGTPIHRFNSDTLATSTNSGTLTNMPSGISGNPTVYWRVNINGFNRVIPCWG